MEVPAGAEEALADRVDLPVVLPDRVALGVDRAAGDPVEVALAGSPSSGSSTAGRSGRTIR